MSKAKFNAHDLVSEHGWMTCANTAKLIRRTLAAQFPGVKFSVRSSTYSGGASIDIAWTDGPNADEVDPHTEIYSGARFDGMIDMAHSVTHWLSRDGGARYGHSNGTAGQRGTHEAYDHPKQGGEISVRFGADYVFTNRHISNDTEQVDQCLEMIRSRCKCDGDAPHDQFGNQWVTTLAQQVAYQREQNETLTDSFNRVVLRNGS